MKDTIHQAIANALTTLGAPEAVFVVERPADMSHGDYASNAAMVAAKQLGQSPRDLAAALEQTLTGTIPGITSTTIAGPGFLNFKVTREYQKETIANILNSKNDWGRNNTEAGELVLIEYTSPNLFKPLHIGNLVGNIVGESFVRLFEFSGATVKRLNYPSDIGLTVAKGVWGLTRTQGNPENISDLGAAYRTGNDAYEAGGAEKDEINAVNRALYANTDPALSALRVAGITTSKKRLSELCSILGTHFDTEIYESEVSERGRDIVKNAIGTVFTESEGAIVYRGEKVGLHTRVFVTSKDLPTYEAKDIGNFTIKDASYPEWTRSLIVTGNEQTEYFKVVFAALRELFPTIQTRALEHVPTGFLTLTTGKMSSRKGNVLTGESLLQELEEEARERATVDNKTIDSLAQTVAVGALKFQILRHNVGSDIVFDKEKALSFEGDSGPYLQYTYARIMSVLEKASAAGIVADAKQGPTTPYELERLLPYFPEVIKGALVERAPHKVVTYLTELAAAFNSFYGHEKIADANDEHAPYKAALAAAVAHTIHNGLWVLGIKAPTRM